MFLLLVILFIFGGCLILLFCGYRQKTDIIGTRAIDRELNRKAIEREPEQNAYVKIEITKPTQ